MEFDRFHDIENKSYEVNDGEYFKRISKQKISMKQRTQNSNIL